MNQTGINMPGHNRVLLVKTTHHSLVIRAYALLAWLVLLATLSGCATRKFFHGIEGSDLSGLVKGYTPAEVEHITGAPISTFACDTGGIRTYLYDRGWTGCVGEGRCKPENESGLHAMEIGADLFSPGMFSGTLNMCIDTCQKGHLEVLYNERNELVGVVEHPAIREGHCWNRWNNSHQGYPCNSIYQHRRPSTVPPGLLLFVDTRVTWEQICDRLPE